MEGWVRNGGKEGGGVERSVHSDDCCILVPGSIFVSGWKILGREGVDGWCMFLVRSSSSFVLFFCCLLVSSGYINNVFLV